MNLTGVNENQLLIWNWENNFGKTYRSITGLLKKGMVVGNNVDYSRAYHFSKIELQENGYVIDNTIQEK
jgi:hypothetical protein